MRTSTRVRACAMGLATALFAGASAIAQEDLAAPETDPFAAAADERVERVDGYTALASPSPIVRDRAAAQLLATRDRAWIPPLVDQLFFVPKGQRGEIQRVLAALAGERHERYLDWVEYVGNHPEIAAPPGYLGWKGAGGRAVPALTLLRRAVVLDDLAVVDAGAKHRLDRLGVVAGRVGR